MDKEQLIQQLMATFLDELEEHTAAFNRDLLALEKSASESERQELFNALFRTAHSLKGAARSVSVAPIEQVCHNLEDLLSALRDGRRALDRDVFGTLFAASDSIEEASMRLREQQDLSGAPVHGVIERLSRTDGPGQASPTEDGDAPVGSSRQPARAEVPSMRVAAEKLDELLSRTGELLVQGRRLDLWHDEVVTLRDLAGVLRREWSKFVHQVRSRDHVAAAALTEIPFLRRFVEFSGRNLQRLERDLDKVVAGLATDTRQVQQASTFIDDEVRRARMLPFSEACRGLERLVRDLAQSAGKEVDLVIEGGTIELDRAVLEGITDPLRQLVRNAIDHGLESPQERTRAGKRAAGRVTITANLQGSQVEIVVRDDGRGVDLEAVRSQLRKRGRPDAGDEQELLASLFLPGLSTATVVTDVSGRGAGLDIVNACIEALHGSIAVTSMAGQGMVFRAIVPLTLTTLRAFLLSVGGQTFALPTMNVDKLLRVSPMDLRTVEGREMLISTDAPLPIVPLSAVLALPQGDDVLAGKLPVVTVAAGGRRLAFIVDNFVSEQEIVIKNLGPRVKQTRFFSGGTILPSGEVALVLNAGNLVRAAFAHGAARRRQAEQRQPDSATRKKILLVEDSLTTRALEKSILEAAGYEVRTAVNGSEAWHFLQEQTVDLIVSDIEMPIMNGFELTESVRAARRLAGIPIVLVTARESDQDKSRGLEAGADAYLIKSAFDQRILLETIQRLL
ncbi:MAG: response regulator [Gemmataceae bacterium]